MRKLFFFLPLLLCSCSSWEESEKDKMRHANETVEKIYRLDQEHFYQLNDPKSVPRHPYPWEKQVVGNVSRITKEYFRCKGNRSNPSYTLNRCQKGEALLFDCEGGSRHPLPLKDGKEYISPLLIDLLNNIQEKTGKKVHITCGHRCPKHNDYAEPGSYGSKHLSAQEVDFYVEGMEYKPTEVVNLIIGYYKDKYPDKSDLTQFKRWEKRSKIATQPWYNKEIFIKLYQKQEGRDLDNAHPYPYLSLQLR